MLGWPVGKSVSAWGRGDVLIELTGVGKPAHCGHHQSLGMGS